MLTSSDLIFAGVIAWKLKCSEEIKIIQLEERTAAIYFSRPFSIGGTCVALLLFACGSHLENMNHVRPSNPAGQDKRYNGRLGVTNRAC